MPGAANDAGVLVIGAGVVGSALAMHLAELGAGEVVVVDPDLAGTRSSSELNAGGVRATWWRPVNIELCAATIAFLREHGARVGFRPLGYLWLYGPQLWAGARSHVTLQRRLGQDVELLSPTQLAARWPEIDRLDGVAGATFSPLDGLVNPNAVKELYRERARAAGARFLDRRLVTGVEVVGRRVRAVRVTAVVDEAQALAILAGAPAGGVEERIPCAQVVNAAGPWASLVAELIGVPVPCRPVPRQISMFECRDVDLSRYGMIVDTTGCYFHHEGGERILAGYSPPADLPGYRFESGGRQFFDTEIWPRLAARLTGMDRLQYVGGWAGLYELSPDRSALLGRIAGRENAYELHSFSGRGVMQSYAAAMALAELIVLGRFETFDAAALTGERFRTGDLQPEELHI